MEAELDKEIRALEAQLAKERAKFEKPAEPARVSVWNCRKRSA